MADALSVAGIGLGAVSLILQVTDECIKMYHYFTEASRMPESFRYLRVRLQMEQQRFLSFAWEAGLLYTDGNLCGTLRLNHTLLEAVLIEIKTLMDTYEETQRKYSDHVPPNGIDWNDRGEPRTDLMNLLSIDRREPGSHSSADEELSRTSRPKKLAAISTQAADKIRKLRVILTDRKRLAWVSSDKQSLENLVTKLGSLNSFLISRLDSSQTTRLEKAVETSYLEMLILRDDVRNLKILVQALNPDISADEGESPLSASTCDTLVETSHLIEANMDGADVERRAHLRRLTTIKLDCLRIATIKDIYEVAATDGSSALVDIESLLRGFSKKTNRSHSLPEERTIFTWEGRSVWVEWVGSPSTQSPSTHRDRETETRVSLLASLLRRELPPSFIVPPCLGYVKSERARHNLKFGLVFQTPPRSITRTASLMTLRKLLGQRPKPSLSTRISLSSSLAECVRSFHSVDWLHKGLRSENIVFLGEGAGHFDLSKPNVTGFELSRPSNEIELTSKPELDLLKDLYRHPRAQSGVESSSYQKSYDLYSLGILLLEIINWRPIEDILQLWPSSMKRGTVRKVKDQILGENIDPDARKAPGLAEPARSLYLAKAGEKGGDAFRCVIENCLAADEIDTLAYRGESNPESKQRLRFVVDEQIAERLRVMKEALEIVS